MTNNGKFKNEGYRPKSQPINEGYKPPKQVTQPAPPPKKP